MSIAHGGPCASTASSAVVKLQSELAIFSATTMTMRRCETPEYRRRDGRRPGPGPRSF